MNIIIFGLLLCSGLPVLINGTFQADLAEEKIKRRLGSGSNIIDSNLGELVFLDEERLAADDISLVKRGIYNNEIEVVIKVIWDHNHFVRELAAYEALNATEDEGIEKYGISRIYYHGKIIGDCSAFAMSPYQETLWNRYQTQGKPVSELTVMLIMKQAVQTLAYLAHNNVLHNDIKPENIFLRDTEVFIGNFGLATLNNEQNPQAGTPFYGSSSYHAKHLQSHGEHKRHAVDDLESLVYSMWTVAGVPMGENFSKYRYYPEGRVMLLCENTNEVIERVKQKCSHFKDSQVGHTLESICIHEIYSKKPVPNYKSIISLLIATIFEINKNDRSNSHSQWLSKSPAESSSRFSRTSSKGEGSNAK